MLPAAFQELERRLAEIDDLDRARALLSWDERTMMPPRGASARAEQGATLRRARHERLTAEGLARVLHDLRPYEESLPRESREASLIRVVRRDHEKARRVPAELAAEIARAASRGERAWLEARERSDFSLFLPYLERNVELRHRYSECFDAAHPYDPLLDDFEPGMTCVEAGRLIDELKSALVPLVSVVASHVDAIDDSCLRGWFPIERQERLLHAIAGKLLPEGSWRLDHTAHPFEAALSLGDVRISTRYDELNIAPAFFSMLHELGHALYDGAIDPTLVRTTLCDAPSLSLHESQSRLWENQIGRGLPFWEHFYPLVQRAFPGELGEIGVEAFHRAVNRMRPTLIRVHADEVTYNLHIILRFELERELFAQRLSVRDLPEAWNARVREYLSLDVPDDANGILQDVHWAEAEFGYFATYAIGNVISGQLWNAMDAALPDLDERIAAGDLRAVRNWLGEHVHRHGRKFTPGETVERAVGEPLDVGPYVSYLESKVADLYGAPREPASVCPPA
jgi:carboxypeptidase Taq